MPLDRRTFLHATALAGASAFAQPLESLVARLASARTPTRFGDLRAPGYGPLTPCVDKTTGLPLLALPPGFQYSSYGWTGDPLDGGKFTPGAHDGMAAFAGPQARVLLIRNPEDTAGRTFDSSLSYDLEAAGGTTTIEFDAEKGAWIGGRTSMAGTARNCAGGPTPWGSWLTCEESLVGPDTGGASGSSTATTPSRCLDRPTRKPLVDMGASRTKRSPSIPPPASTKPRMVRACIASFRRCPAMRQRRQAGDAGDRRPVRADLRGGQRRRRISDCVGRPIIPIARTIWDRRQGRLPWGFARGAATFARLEGAWHGGGKIFT
jgi:hypothetical protein